MVTVEAKANSEKVKEVDIDDFSFQKEMRPQWKQFADFILKGYSQTDAYFMAGFMAGKDRNSPRVRDNACNLASNLVKKPIIKSYLLMNKPVDLVYGKVDPDEVIERLKLICFGSVVVNSVTKKGEKVSLPPTFKDQIDASKLLLHWYEKEQKGNEIREEKEEAQVLINGYNDIHKRLETTRFAEDIVDEC